MASPEISLKLLIDIKGSRVLFAEVPKEFVDFLFHILSLPLGSFMELIGSSNMIGSLDKLKDSIKSFPQNHLQPGIKPDDIFYPKTPFNGDMFLLSYDRSSKDQSAGASKAVYWCLNASSYYSNNLGPCNTVPYCHLYATMCPSSKCPNCSRSMNIPKPLITPPKEVLERKEEDKKQNKGYVKEVVTYMVMDDLQVKPMSTISSITLINKLGVKDLGQLEEKIVSFGKEEGLKLLKAFLKTEKVLSTIFMH